MVISVSSTASCSSAAATVVSSRPMSATILATDERVVDVLLAALAVLVARAPRRPPRRPARWWPMGAFGWRWRKASTTGAISSAGIGAWRRHGRTRSTVAIALPRLLVDDEALHLVALAGCPGRASGSSSMAKPRPTTSAPSPSTRRTAAAAVPPVASTSSTISTRSPGRMASRWISSLSVPYSSMYSSRATAHGSLPGLADRDERRAPSVGHGCGQDETAGLDADHPVDLDPGEAVGDGVDGEAEGVRIAEQRA